MTTPVDCSHPVSLRLSRQAGFNVRSPKSLIGAGFLSMAMGLLTTFRYTPLMLYCVINYFAQVDDFLKRSQMVLTAIIYVWVGVILFVLFIFGFILLFAVKLRSKELLMAHPWGLLLLYFDFLVWMVFTILVDVLSTHHASEKNINNPKAFLIAMYVENFVFLIIYYLYATYYIAAELTVIERFYTDDT